MFIEIIILFLVIVAVVAIYYFLKAATHLIVNAIIGIIILMLSNFILKLGIVYTIPTILVCVFGGIPGTVLVVLLHVLRIAF